MKLFIIPIWVWKVVICMIVAIPSARCSEVINFSSKNLDNRLAAGKEQMAKLQTYSKLPSNNDCWKSALRDLETGCNILTQEIQSKLAFAFTSCFNVMLGSPPYMCEKSTPIKDCIRSLDANSMNTFRDYFLHTQDMCFYIRQEMWQEETDRAVNELTDVTIGVTKNMVKTQSAQEKILESQQESLKVQSNLVKDNNLLYKTIIRVKEVFDDFKHSADEHRLVFLEIFDKLSKMQTLVSWIQGEMSLLDTVGFYFACLVLGILATSSEKTSHVRVWIVMLFITSLMMERHIHGHFDDSDLPPEPEDIQYYIWFVRRGAVISGVILIIVAAANYRDPLVENRKLLTDIYVGVLHLIDEGKGKASPYLTNGAVKKSNDDSYSCNSSLSGSKSSDSFSSYSTDSEDSSDISSDFSDDSPPNETDAILGDQLPMGSSTPNGTPVGKYNLRNRKSVVYNPAKLTERTSDFAKVVKISLKLPKIRSSHYYSSDDDI